MTTSKKESSNLDKEYQKLCKDLDKFGIGTKKKQTPEAAGTFSKRIDDLLAKVENALKNDPNNEILKNRQDQLLILQSVAKNLISKGAIDPVARKLIAHYAYVSISGYSYPYDKINTYTAIKKWEVLDDNEKKSPVYKSMLEVIDKRREQRFLDLSKEARLLYEKIETADPKDVYRFRYQLEYIRIQMSELASDRLDSKQQLELSKITSLHDMFRAVANVNEKTSIVSKPDAARLEVYKELQKVAGEFKKDVFEDVQYQQVNIAISNAISAHKMNPARCSMIASFGNALSFGLGLMASCSIAGAVLGVPIMIKTGHQLFNPHTKEAADNLTTTMETHNTSLAQHVPLSKESLHKLQEEEKEYQEYQEYVSKNPNPKV